MNQGTYFALHPKDPAVYDLLSDCLHGKTAVGSSHAFDALVRIANDKSVAVLDKYVTSSISNTKHQDRSTTILILYKLGLNRHKVAIYEYLLKLADNAPTDSIRLLIMKSLTEDKSTINLPLNEIPKYPAYALVKEGDRAAMKNILSKVDLKRFDKDSISRIEMLKKMIE